MARNAGELTAVIKRHLAGDESEVALREDGRVTRVGDGIAHIDGLEHAMSGELLAFPGDVVGMVPNLERHDVGAVLFGPDTGIEEGYAPGVTDHDAHAEDGGEA
jgi:F-type H+-transporting ATPase subunit alpha